MFASTCRKLLAGTVLVLAGLAGHPQQDSAYLLACYTRSMHFDESKVDSIKYYADLLSNASLRSNYSNAHFFALRLRGYYFENKSEYGKAIDYYLQSLQEARRTKSVENQKKALTDLAAVYTIDLKQPGNARLFYLECVELNKQNGDAKSLVATYTNLGAIYNRLGLYDSALYFMKEGLRLGKPLEERGEDDLTTLYNNMGNTYFLKKEFAASIPYFTKDYLQHSREQSLPDIWLDVLNLADSYSELSQFKPATRYADSALLIAEQLHSTSKEADSYSVLAKLYQHKGEYQKAYDYLQDWYRRDTAMVNESTFKTIAELQEKFHDRERENEKLVLESEVARAKFNNRIILLAALGFLVTGLLVLVAFIIKRNANRKLQQTNALITRQNEKLAELNDEKNSLISIVSHDLSTPFASIDMWTQLLEQDPATLNEEQKKAVSRIRKSTRYGQTLIRNILDVEKAETSRHKLNLEEFDLTVFAETVVE
ncbi:MAG TPA: histidine kinase dimerization/phospho-acceptor domain-containing protein, partial [Puia sp.]|nr:histidine kinase dimerization/phospho-acceptor domain-containing protein [Puia sp.]